MARYIEFTSQRCEFRPIGFGQNSNSFEDQYPELARFVIGTDIEQLMDPKCEYYSELDCIVSDVEEFQVFKKIVSQDGFFFAAFEQTGVKKDQAGNESLYTTESDVKRFILERLKNWLNPDACDYEFAIYADNSVVGYAELFDKKTVNGKSQYERGVFIDPQYQGKKYGKEAMIALTKFAFEVLQIDQIFTMVDPENEASRNNIERNFGAVFIGQEPSKYSHLDGGGTDRRKYLIFPDNFYTAINEAKPTPIKHKKGMLPGYKAA